MGLDRATSNVRRIPTRFSFAHDVESLADELHLNRWQRYVVMTTKAIILHHSQVLLFVVPFVAYMASMGTYQRVFAIVVVFKEAWHFFLTWIGMFVNPNFLLFTPSTEEDRRYTLQYALDPEVFIAQSISFRDGDPPAHVRWLPLSEFTLWISVVGGICAWLCLFIGTLGDGAMYPSLFVGYLISGAAPLALLIESGENIVANEYRFREDEPHDYTGTVGVRPNLFASFPIQFHGD